MKTLVADHLLSLDLGTPQVYRNIVIVPLLAPGPGKFEYVTLPEALGQQTLAITEVSTAGSVPELLVVNRGASAVLLVDGEELAGAKQNRVLNTSVLIKEQSETKVPVSCTEQGRWGYSSPAFEQSGNVMAHKMRARKSRSVSESLQRDASFASDQGQVWEDIQMLACQAKASSPTSAMKDVFAAREEELKQCADVFQIVPGQVGLVVMIDGAPAGLDLVSLGRAYERLHPKLVRSYALEALLGSESAPVKGNGWSEKAGAFLREAARAESASFPSLGYGTDHRLTARNLGGTALVHAEEVIHAAFFRLVETPVSEGMASLQRRRRRFTE